MHYLWESVVRDYSVVYSVALWLTYGFTRGLLETGGFFPPLIFLVDSLLRCRWIVSYLIWLTYLVIDCSSDT